MNKIYVSTMPVNNSAFKFSFAKRIISFSLISLFLLFGYQSSYGQTTTYSSPGTYTWTCPAGVTSVTVQCWGGGGAGGGANATSAKSAGGGGAGGSFAQITNFSVTPGNTYTVVVGAGGTIVNGGAGNAGSTSSFNTSTVIAVGGAGGKLGTNGLGSTTAGSTTGDAGTTPFYAGGTGAAASSTSTPNSGGGGGGAGTTHVGGNGSGTTGGAGGAAGGGAGAAGLSGAGEPENGITGNAPGGGGSGGATAYGGTVPGGAGGAGQVIISCSVCTSCVTPGSPTSLSGTAASSTTANLSWATGSPAGAPGTVTTYNWYVSTSPSGVCSLTPSTIFTYTGSLQTWQVPSGVSSVNVQMWGAGGGSGEYTTGDYASGGCGGYVSGTLAVTPGSTINIVVGQGGLFASTAATYGGGGGEGIGGYGGSGGGGRSAIQLTSGTDYVTAGGGGGAGNAYYNTSGSASSGIGYGGAGGSTTADGTSATYLCSAGAGGGTQSAGGAAGIGTGGTGTAGSQYTGGQGCTSGSSAGGGGGGYYGGGGGGTSPSNGGNGGGGGSSFVTNLTGTVVNLIGYINSSAGIAAAPYTGTNYISGVGVGGTGSTPMNGGNGLVVITYNNTAVVASGSTTATTATATGLSTGTTYYLSVNASTSCNSSTTSNCTTSSSFTTCTAVAPTLTATANTFSVSPVYNVSGTSVSLSQTTTGGTNCGAWLYAWSNDGGTTFWNGSAFSGGANYNASYASIAPVINANTTYTVYVEGTGSVSSLASSSITVDVITLPALTAEANGTAGSLAIPNNTPVNLTANASGGSCTGTLLFAWSDDGGTTFWNGSAFSGGANYNASYSAITTPNLTAGATFTCYVQCSNSNNATASSAVTVTIGACATPSLVAVANNAQGTVTISVGGSVNLAVLTTGGNYCDGGGLWGYAWTDNNGNWWSDIDGAFDSPTPNYTNADSSITFTASLSPGDTTYTVYAQCMNNAGCNSGANGGSVTVDLSTACASPTLTAKADGTLGESITNNTSVVLTANPGGGANCTGGQFVYAWSDDGGTTFWNGSMFSGTADYDPTFVTITVPNITTATTFTAYVQCSDSLGCVGTPSSVSVAITPCSAPSLTAKADGTTGETIANNTNVALTANPSGGGNCDGNGSFQYAWSDDGGTTFWNGSSFSSLTAIYNTAYNNINLIGVTSTLTYTAYVNCSNNAGCSNSGSVTVTVAPCSAPTLTAKADGTTGETIANNTNVALTANSSGGTYCDGNGSFQYAWSDDGGTTFWNGSSFSGGATWSSSYNNISLTGVTSTLTYTVYVQCSNNTGCSNSSSVTVTVAPCSAPALTAEADGTIGETVANNVNVALTANSSGGSYCDGNGSFQYAWTNGTNWWNGSSFGSATAIYNTAYNNINLTGVTSTLTYTAYVNCSNNAGCTNNSAVTVTVAPCSAPVLTAEANGTAVSVTAGSTFPLTANPVGGNYCDGNGSFQYAWSNNGGASGSWWNGTNFTGTSASYNTAYSSITPTNVFIVTTFTVYAQCANNAGCSSAGSAVTVTPYQCVPTPVSIGVTVNYTANQPSSSSPAFTTCATYDADEVWYQFTALSTALYFNLPPASAAAALQVFEGSCGNYVLESCTSWSNGLNWYVSGFVPGTTYTIRIYRNTTGTATMTGSFTIYDAVSLNPGSGVGWTGSLTINQSGTAYIDSTGEIQSGGQNGWEVWGWAKYPTTNIPSVATITGVVSFQTDSVNATPSSSFSNYPYYTYGFSFTGLSVDPVANFYTPANISAGIGSTAFSSEDQTLYSITPGSPIGIGLNSTGIASLQSNLSNGWWALCYNWINSVFNNDYITFYGYESPANAPNLFVTYTVPNVTLTVTGAGPGANPANGTYTYPGGTPITATSGTLAGPCIYWTGTGSVVSGAGTSTSLQLYANSTLNWNSGNYPPAPTGNASQSFCSNTNPTIANLSVTGSNILWYYAASGGLTLSTSTPLVNGTTYYASQTVGCESQSRFAVTATVNAAPTTSSTSETTCASYTWNSVTYTSSGTYTYDAGNTSNSVGCDSVATLNLTITGPCAFTYNVKLFLQGYYTGGSTMSPLLHLLGAASTTAVDTVTVEFHPAATPATIAYSFTGVLQTNGMVSGILSAGALTGTYYIVTKHRNGLDTWSANPVALTSNGTYDFTTGAGQAYGSNAVNLGGGVYGIYGGDVNKDGTINSLDLTQMQSVLPSFTIGVYNVNDITGDGFVDDEDYRILKNNTGKSVSHP